MASTDVASKQERVRTHVTGRHMAISRVLQNTTSCKSLAGRCDDGHAAARNGLFSLGTTEKRYAAEHSHVSRAHTPGEKFGLPSKQSKHGYDSKHHDPANSRRQL